MDVITINNREVIKCAHCNGTGICQHTEIKEVCLENYPRKGYYAPGAVLTCSKCGDGSFQRAVGFLGNLPEPRNMKAPVCKVCGGKGHTVVI